MEKPQHYEIRKGAYHISTDTSLLDIEMVHNYLSLESYWAKDIPIDIVKRSIANSLCFGLYGEGRQVGFARVISDRATFAYLGDVFIVQEHRGKGLSTWLLQTIHQHPDLQGLRRWMLGTRDAHGLYEKFGWTILDEDTRKRFMQKHNKNIYQSG